MVVISSNFTAPVDGILFQTPSTKLLVNNQELGTATLYITEHNVVWGGGVRPTGGPAPSINLLYPSISLHAIQRDPSPALYMVLNYELRLPELAQAGSGDANDDDDDFDAEDQPITQLRFVPSSEHDLQPMYAAMSQGQALHPDPADVDDDDPYMDGEDFDDAGDEEFEDAEEEDLAEDEAAARLRQLRVDSNGANHVDGEDAEIEEE
ncbi:methylosome subunit pICln isoform X5 [Ostrinia furnacalis]|uniref:methylosome subunit pICln isoform X4 n=1 Tax=Ostrinia furnacalis TaxID=93504 RepID=UPI00103C0CCB|nr:methylosome subunit pICln isoform X4 [Ostrinia furnacalis]XP_028157347.1 methylosome subunit pICln isoform X5 [Ostrinia furnacalis]